jgi:hypothetical protein
VWDKPSFGDDSYLELMYLSNVPISPAFENRSSAQVVRHVPELPYCLPQRVDQSAEQRQYAGNVILLENVGSTSAL